MYLKELLSDITVASIVPTRERYVVQALSGLPLEEARVVVEYGPGNGVFTRHILERGSADCRVIAIESNQTLARKLSERLNDPRLEIVQGCARDLSRILAERSLSMVDQVISGIPFTLIPATVRETICAETARHLSSRGTFLLYQSQIPGGRAFVQRLIRPWFTVRQTKELFFNLPPLYVLEAAVRQDLAPDT